MKLCADLSTSNPPCMISTRIAYENLHLLLHTESYLHHEKISYGNKHNATAKVHKILRW